MSTQDPIHNHHILPFNPEEKITRDSQATTFLDEIPKNNSPTTSSSLETIGEITGGHAVKDLKKELSTCQNLSKNLALTTLGVLEVETHLTTSPLAHSNELTTNSAIQNDCTTFESSCLKKALYFSNS